ncbi:hypothetical protein GGTG_02027 [Gaeumannomyces tritici R3-111a-1]|uniref:Uncharacterized protein n=1 Tax=Gaeumannomyces tritici (strain R3-111a-1) TaxID=644352 RepID=J3NL85_GAET3|nr:hypothetical protein GGTG_02027 [Gaeumannomyces tritici R3-111a-1]EJT82053.1 hypothetical protein GGTG_02027 [Gaeumannomyces tritici R3-111a-1]
MKHTATRDLVRIAGYEDEYQGAHHVRMFLCRAHYDAVKSQQPLRQTRPGPRAAGKEAEEALSSYFSPARPCIASKALLPHAGT